MKLWEVADVVEDFRRKGLLFRDFAGKDFESRRLFSPVVQPLAWEICGGRLWDVCFCFHFLRSYSLFEGSDFCEVVPILRENSSKSIFCLRTFQGLSFDVASLNAVDVRFRSSERVTSAVETVSPCCARLFWS